MTRTARGLAAGLVTLLALGAIHLSFRAPSPPIVVPSFSDVKARHRPSDLVLLDRHGEVIHERRVDPRWRRLAWTPLDEISPAIRSAVLAAEDRRFDRHGGVDFHALAAAGLGRVLGGAPRGASTVTMQLGTLLDPTLARRGGPRTLTQKWRQMRLAWAIESRWSKSQILEAYLNRVTFRGELEGVPAAAGVLFGKAPHGVGEAEAAVLAALVRAPNASRQATARRAGALVAHQGWTVSAETLEAAVHGALEAPVGGGPRVAQAPHAAARLMPVQATGAISAVSSTLDAGVQRVAAEALRRHLMAMRARHVQDGAVLVVDNATGEVLAYVGGDPDLGSARFVSGIHARRQAGSSLKPFLYGRAFDERLLTASSLLEDTPLELAVAGGLYRPRNYDEHWKGLVSARAALGSSLNVPAVRILELLGGEAAVDLLRQLGFDGLREDGDFYGPSLALGSADVSLWELVGAYRALARGGVWSPLRMTPAGPLDARPRRVYSEEAAFLVANVLADREGRSLTFGLESPLATPFWTAVKTGTSKEMRDNWCVGFSRRYTVGVWVGNFSGEPMRNVSGITGAAPIWVEIMTWLHRSAPSPAPAAPRGVVARPVRLARTGEAERIEWFLRGTEPITPESTPGGERPRITSPVAGTVVALDPDIPEPRQRLVLEAAGGLASLEWRVDGAPAGPASRLAVWEPTPGRHTISLVDGAERVIDTISLEVRGAALHSPQRH